MIPPVPLPPPFLTILLFDQTFIVEVSSPKEKKEIIGNTKLEKQAENSEIFTNILPERIGKKFHRRSQGGYLPYVPTLSNFELNRGVVTWRNEWDGLPSVGTSCN
jgi:hypothetical protein